MRQKYKKSPEKRGDGEYLMQAIIRGAVDGKELIW